MKKITSLVRVVILLALGFTAIFGILSIPADDNSDLWFSILILSKIIGIAAAAILSHLYPLWVMTDDLIAAIHHHLVESVNHSRL